MTLSEEEKARRRGLDKIRSQRKRDRKKLLQVNKEREKEGLPPWTLQHYQSSKGGIEELQPGPSGDAAQVDPEVEPPQAK